MQQIIIATNNSCIIGIWPVQDYELKVRKEGCPSSLPVCKSLSIFKYIILVQKHDERMISSHEPVPPLFQGQMYCQEHCLP